MMLLLSRRVRLALTLVEVLVVVAALALLALCLLPGLAKANFPGQRVYEMGIYDGVF